MNEVRYLKRQVKSIINVYKYIDSWYWTRYSLSAYQGCEFNCIYCYARSQKYNRSFGDKNTIYIKKDAALMLDRRIERARTLMPDVVGISGVCDPYQSGEKKYKKTRNLLEVLANHVWPVHILTKSDLILKDVDILSKIAADSWAAVTFTITTIDDDITRFLEPQAPLPGQRFEALFKIKQKNSKIQAGIAAIPVVPFLEDNEKNITGLIKRAKKAGADYFLFSPGMTMDSDQAVRYMKHLNRRFPDLVSKYEELYKFKYSPLDYSGDYSPQGSYVVRLSKQVFKILEKYDMPYRIKRFIPNDYRKLNYILSEKLLNQAYKLQYTGKAWSNLHWAGQNIQNLRESVTDIASRGKLKKIRNVNDEIESFIIKNIK